MGTAKELTSLVVLILLIITITIIERRLTSHSCHLLPNHPTTHPSNQLLILQIFAGSPNATQILRSTGRWQSILKKPTITEVTEKLKQLHEALPPASARICTSYTHRLLRHNRTLLRPWFRERTPLRCIFREARATLTHLTSKILMHIKYTEWLWTVIIENNNSVND